MYPARFARDDDRFFLITAFAMAAVVVAGFSMQLAMGRSSFASPLRVHSHAVVFMGLYTLLGLGTCLVLWSLARRLYGESVAAWTVVSIAVVLSLSYPRAILRQWLVAARRSIATRPDGSP